MAISSSSSSASSTSTVNATVAGGASVRTKIQLVERADGTFAVPATVAGARKSLLLSLYQPNVLLTCDPAHPDCPTEETCSTRFNTFQASRCATLVDSKRFQLGDYSTEDMQVALLSFSSTDIVPSGLDGILGLALAAIPTDIGTTYLSLEATDVLTRQWASFSLHLSAPKDSGGSGDGSSFLMLNGVDDALIRNQSLTPHVLPVKLANGWTPRLEAFLVDGVEFEYFSLLCFYENTCVVLDPSSRFVLLDKFALDPILDLVRCTAAGNYEKDEADYWCDADQEFPSIGFTFGDTTFYLTGKQYTRVAADRAGQVELLLKKSYGGGGAVLLGAPFLSNFYSSFDRRSGIALYCRDGVNCAPKGVPIQGVAASGKDKAKSSSASTSSNSDSMVTMIVIVVAVVVVAAVIGLVVLWRKRQTRARDVHKMTEPQDDLSVTPGPEQREQQHAYAASQEQDSEAQIPTAEDVAIRRDL